MNAIKKHLRLYYQFSALQEALHQFYDALSLNRLNDKTPSISRKAKEAAHALFSELQTSINPFFNKRNGLINKERLSHFKTQCLRIFDDKKRLDTIKEHPQLWYRIHPILRNILGILSAITVLPGLIVHYSSTDGFSSVFFKTPLSHGATRLEQIKRATEDVKGEDDSEIEHTPKTCV